MRSTCAARETAAASALAGVITDPRALDMPYPRITEPAAPGSARHLLTPPPEDCTAELIKGPGHVSLPDFDPIGDELEVPLLLRVGDNVSTDEIMPAGADGMSVWSSLPGMAEHTFGRAVGRAGAVAAGGEEAGPSAHVAAAGAD